MDRFLQFASAIYYVGLGSVLFGTTLAVIYRFFRNQHLESDYINELREIHLPNIYNALEALATKLDVRLEMKRPGEKPLGGNSETKWILFD